MSILGDQVRHAQSNVAAAEQALRDFRVGAVTSLSSDGAPMLGGGRDPAFANFFEMKVTQEQLRRDRVALARVLAQVADSGLSVDALEMIGAEEI